MPAHYAQNQLYPEVYFEPDNHEELDINPSYTTAEVGVHQQYVTSPINCLQYITTYHPWFGLYLYQHPSTVYWNPHNQMFYCCTIQVSNVINYPE